MSPQTRKAAVLLLVGVALGAGLMAILYRALGAAGGPERDAPVAAADAGAAGPSAAGEGAGGGRPLEGDCVFAGSVRTIDGAPIPGAIVRLRFLDEPWPSAELPLEAKADAGGRFAFPGVDRAGAYQLWAWAEGFAVGSVERAPCGAAADLALEPGGGLSLRILGPDGAPAGPADVQIAGSGLWPAREARAGADGRLEVAGLAPGFYTVHAVVADAGLAYLSEDPVAIEAGEVRAVEIRLAASAPATVRVVDAASSAPIASAVVTVGPAAGAMIRRVAAVDAKGVAVFPGLVRADFLASASAPGYAPSAARSIGPGEEVALRLERGFAARGVVRTREGTPVAGAAIAAEIELGDALAAVSGTRQHQFLEHVLGAAAGGWPRLVAGPRAGLALAGPGQIPVPDTGAGPSPRWRPTDANGRFEVDGLPAGRVVLSAAHPEYVTTAPASLSLAPGATPPDVEIVVQLGTVVAVRTLDEAGYPIRDARVAVYDGREELLAEAATGTDGYAEIKGLPGSFRVVASADGAVPAAAAVSGRPGERLEIAVTLPAADGVLRGRVVDERGYGVPGAAITARALGRNLAQVVLGGTAGDGSFALDGVGRGPYHVTAEVDGAVRAQVIGATAERESVLVLGEPIARAALAGGDTVIEPGLGGPGLVEPSAFDGETYPADPSGGDSLGVVAITERRDPDWAGAQTAGSYDTPYGQADQLVVTGPPSGPGGLPITLGPGAAGGVVVKAVQPGSQVAGAGLAVGDRVVAVDGAPIKSVAQAKAAIAGRIGTVVMLEVVHEGEHINVVVQRVRVPQ